MKTLVSTVLISQFQNPRVSLKLKFTTKSLNLVAVSVAAQLLFQMAPSQKKTTFLSMKY